MITLQQWFSAVNYKVTEGSEYTWECYGDHAYRLEYWDGNHDGVSAEIIYDTYDQNVYEVTIHDIGNNRAYRIVNPDYLAALKNEAAHRNCPYDEAWEDVAYIDLELDFDWLEKASAIIDGREYDERIQIELNLPDEEVYVLMKEAHKKDMTFNQYVEFVVSKVVDDFISEQEGKKQS